MASLASTVRNFQLFLDNVGYAGNVDEVTLPKLTEKTDERVAAGMIGARKVGLRNLEAMEASMMSKSILPAFVSSFSQASTWTLRRALVDMDGTTHAERVVLIGDVHSIDDGTTKVGEAAQITATMDVHHYERHIDGVELIYIDIDTSTWRINGVDQYAEIKNAINQ